MYPQMSRVSDSSIHTINGICTLVQTEKPWRKGIAVLFLACRLHTGRFGNCGPKRAHAPPEICGKLALPFTGAKGVRWGAPAAGSGTPCTTQREVDGTCWKMAETSLERLHGRNLQGNGDGGGWLSHWEFCRHVHRHKLSRRLWQLCHSQCSNGWWWHRLLHGVCILGKPPCVSISMFRSRHSIVEYHHKKS